MSDDRKKPGAAFWTTLVVVAMLVYPLCYGPACWGINWMANKGWLRPDTDWIRQLIFLIFCPIRLLHSDGPKPISDLIDWYAHLWY
jgi:hypothetical protein